MDLVDNKVVLVIDGAQGMGASHVRKLVDEGASVMISDILIDKGEALAKELGEKVKFVELDVTKRDAWN